MYIYIYNDIYQMYIYIIFNHEILEIFIKLVNYISTKNRTQKNISFFIKIVVCRHYIISIII